MYYGVGGRWRNCAVEGCGGRLSARLGCEVVAESVGLDNIRAIACSVCNMLMCLSGGGRGLSCAAVVCTHRVAGGMELHATRS